MKFRYIFIFVLLFIISACNKTETKEPEKSLLEDEQTIIKTENIETNIPTKSDIHEHTYTHVATNQKGHLKLYTCGCESTQEVFPHVDEDLDNRCDLCVFNLTGYYNGENFTIGTYYFPYSVKYQPIALRFDENNVYYFIYEDANQNTSGYKYEIIDGYIYMYIGRNETEKSYVFKITDYGIVLDSKKTTANLWDSNIYRGEAVIFYLEGTSAETIISTTYQVINEYEEMPEIQKIYDSYEINGNTAYAVMMKVAAVAAEWADKIYGTDYTFTYTDGREIEIYYKNAFYDLNTAYDRGCITLDDLEKLNENHHDCEIAHSYDEGVVVLPTTQTPGDVGSILYTCTICGETETVGLPQEFSFSLTFGFDGYYNSLTGELRNGYNFDLDTKCETTLFFTDEELLDICRILYNGNITNYQENIHVSEDMMDPSFDIRISYSINYQEYSFSIFGASDLSYLSDWEVGYELAVAYTKVVKDYIKNSEEFKSLPPNQQVYE